MKKNGFTLAEVLITLAIIGVIATMTLPSLMTNTAEQQAKTGLKKGINMFQNAVEMNAAAAGFDYSTIISPNVNTGDDPQGQQSLYAILANRTQVDFGKTGMNSSAIDQRSGRGAAPEAVATEMVVTFRDGSSLMYVPSQTEATAEKSNIQAADQLPRGFSAVFDTNGRKAPNIISNCQGAALGVAFAEDATGDDAGAVVPGNAETFTNDVNDQCTTARRVIKDQFLLQFRGTTVQPRGAAAQWAYNES